MRRIDSCVQRDGKAGFYAPTRFREIKRKVQRLVNADHEGMKIEFNIKTFRDTHC